MIGVSQGFDREGRRRAQAIGDHQHLVMNLLVFLHLDLWIVLCIFPHEFYLVAVDPANSIDVVKKHLNAYRQRIPNRGCHRAGVRREYPQGDRLMRYIDATASFESTPTGTA